MCRGKPEHHKQEEIRRAGGIATSIAHQAMLDRRAEQDRMVAMQQEADRRQQEALRMIAESSKQPFKVKTAADATTPLMRTRQKQSPTGVAALRINRTPSTNIGMGIGGTNIG